MTLAQFSGNFDRLESQIPIIVDEAFQAAIDEIDTQITNRIFNENVDINGKSFGKYKSKAYEEFRKSLGRQTTTKDLQLNKDLLISFVKDYGKRLIRFNNITNQNKGRGQEKQLKTKIFEASEEEVDIAVSVLEEVFVEGIRQVLNGER